MRRKLLIAGCILILGLVSCILLASIAPNEAIGQGIFLAVGLCLYVGVQFSSPRVYHKALPFVTVTTFLLLCVTLVLGRVSHGAMRWLPIGPFHIQMSEFAKPLLALVVSTYVCTYPLTNQRRIIGFFVCSGLFFLPVFLQPDLGSALVLLVITLSALLLSVRKLRMLLPWGASAVMVSLLMWNYVLYDYQKDRLVSFLSGQGEAVYNAEQAYIAVGSGKLFGRGLGHGVQSSLRFLPEFHTDFFFASLAEELGLVGISIVLILYLTLFGLLLSLPRHATYFVRLATYAFVCALFFQMAINMGMNMKLFPITGIPLPLLSSGGSSFLSVCLGLGVLVRLSDERA